MRLPSREYALPGGLVCPIDEVKREIWQEHVVKHPLGVQAIARSAGRDPWNQEGWDVLEPPALTDSDRTALVGAIAELREGKLRCEVPELRGKKVVSNPARLACRDCQPPVVVRCQKLLNAPGAVGERYRDVTESLLRQLSDDDGVQVSVGAFDTALFKALAMPAKLTGVVVLMVGLDDRRATLPIVRINSHNGVRAEFYLQRGRLSWRTTYREVARTRTVSALFSFLSDRPRPTPSLGSVSELCVVARRWWEAHGI
jgi:hypothetical protein